MTFFWSSWITVLSIMCWGGILGVLLMVLKYKPEVEELLKDFIKLGFPEYTPTGNRTFLEIPVNELINKF